MENFLEIVKTTPGLSSCCIASVCGDVCIFNDDDEQIVSSFALPDGNNIDDNDGDGKEVVGEEVEED